MENQQNPTNTAGAKTVTPQIASDADRAQKLKLQQELYIDYCAVQGMITESDGAIKTMTVTDFAKRLQVDRTTLYDWQKRIPGFWDLVAKRRKQIFSQARVSKVWNGVYLRASRGDAEQAKIFLSQFDGWQPPMQRQEVKLSGLADLVNVARKKKIIEGQVADDGHNAG